MILARSEISPLAISGKKIWRTKIVRAKVRAPLIAVYIYLHINYYEENSQLR
jgi:hypothetical protein